MPIITKILSTLTLLSTVVLIFILILSIFFRKTKFYHKISQYFSDKAILFSFIIALTSMLGSLYYSNIKMWEPCVLCWYERIFMYPLVFVFGLNIWKKVKNIEVLALWVSVPGFLYAVYHYFGQAIFTTSTFCLTSGEGCSKMYFWQYGYITIPMMCLTAFILIIYLMNNRLRHIRK